MATSAYDVYLGDIATLQGYRCRSLLRDTAPLVAPRFSSGEQGETDLDLLKSVSLVDLTGGMFQKEWVDNKKVTRAIGIYNPQNNNTYPALPKNTVSGTQVGYTTAKIETELFSFWVSYEANSGVAHNHLYRADKNSGVITEITMPAAIASTGTPGITITGLCIHKNWLFICGQNATGSFNIQKMKLSDNTFTTCGTNIGVTMVSMRGVLYLINLGGDIYSWTSEDTTAPVATLIETVGNGATSASVTAVIEFNGAAWISTATGIWRFDGVRPAKILPFTTNQFCQFNGALYFFSGLWLYKFDGTNVQKLQFFGNQEQLNAFSLSSSPDFLFIQTYTPVTNATNYPSDDKGFAAFNSFRRIYTYNGVAFMMLAETYGTFQTAPVNTLLYVAGVLFDFICELTLTSWGINTKFYYDLTKFFDATAVTTASLLDITLSEHHAGYTNIFKSLEVIEANYIGMVAGDSLAVTYQLYDGKTWGSWISAGTITSSTDNKIEITDATKKLYKRVKVNFTLTPAAGSTVSFKGASLRFTLQPRMRWRWQLSVMAEGNSTTSDRNQNPITANANALSATVVKSIKQKTPLIMLAPDYGTVKAQITNAALTFIVKGQIPVYTDPYSEYPLVGVMNNSGVWEVLRVASASYVGGATNETTITVLERGYRGVTPAQINAGAEFHLAYKVYVTRLLRDSPDLSDPIYNEQPTGESQLQREFLLELTEV